MLSQTQSVDCTINLKWTRCFQPNCIPLAACLYIMRLLVSLSLSLTHSLSLPLSLSLSFSCFSFSSFAFHPRNTFVSSFLLVDAAIRIALLSSYRNRILPSSFMLSVYGFLLGLIIVVKSYCPQRIITLFFTCLTTVGLILPLMSIPPPEVLKLEVSRKLLQFLFDLGFRQGLPFHPPDSSLPPPPPTAVPTLPQLSEGT